MWKQNPHPDPLPEYREREMKSGRGELSGEETLDRVDRRFALDGGDGFEEGDVLGADFDAVARFGAVGNAAFLHHDVEAFALEGLADRVVVEEAHLTDDGGADELVGRGVLRAGFEAAAARDAAREGVALFLQFLG